jgi:hypothetical protein
MIPTEIREPFHRDGWVYEEKVDGWRILAYKDVAGVRLLNRGKVMMQFARQAPLVFVLLLASVGTASAERAWVLWVDAWHVGYSPLDAFTSRDACERERYSDRTKTLAAEVKGFPVCLPDTIDPRGPKTK